MTKKIQNPKGSILIIVLIMTIFLGLVGVLVLQIFQSIYIQSGIVHDYYKAYYISNAGIEISLVKHKVRDYQPFEDESDYTTTIKNITYGTVISVKNLEKKICKTLNGGESTNIYMYYYDADKNLKADIGKPQESYKDIENNVSFGNINGSLEYTIGSYNQNTKELIDTAGAGNGNNDGLFSKPLSTTPINIGGGGIHKISIANVGSSNGNFCINGTNIPSDTLNISSIGKYKNSTIKLTAIKKMNDL